MPTHSPRALLAFSLVAAFTAGTAHAAQLQAPMTPVGPDGTGKALMVHAGGDNFADQPAPLGGGGTRIACGVIE